MSTFDDRWSALPRPSHEKVGTFVLGRRGDWVCFDYRRRGADVAVPFVMHVTEAGTLLRDLQAVLNSEGIVGCVDGVYEGGFPNPEQVVRK